MFNKLFTYLLILFLLILYRSNIISIGAKLTDRHEKQEVRIYTKSDMRFWFIEIVARRQRQS